MITAGDRVTIDHTGETATVTAVRCGRCQRSQPHETCEPFAQVGPSRWVNTDHLTKEESHG
jgi:hypothetical protein